MGEIVLLRRMSADTAERDGSDGTWLPTFRALSTQGEPTDLLSSKISSLPSGTMDKWPAFCQYWDLGAENFDGSTRERRTG